MKPVLVTVVSSSPAVWKPYAAARSDPAPRPAAQPAGGRRRSDPQANGASAAVEIANRTPYGLAGAVWTRDIYKAFRVVKKIRAGIVWVNHMQPTYVEAPWGGYKMSGQGRELGRYSFQQELGDTASRDRDAGDGSIMIVVATDAPLDSRNLERLASRAMAGVARTGSSMSNGSGDYVIAFSTAASVRRGTDAGVRKVEDAGNNAMSPLFEAVCVPCSAYGVNLFLRENASSSPEIWVHRP